MPKDFEKLLSDIGLLPSEVSVYLSALELGPSSIQNIAKKAGISRTATYEAVEMLQNRGLISSSSSGKHSLFSAEDPERIVSYMQSEQQRFQALMTDVGRSVESMRLISGGIRPTVRVFEGEEALRAYYDHVAQVKPRDFSEITNVDDVYQFLDANTIQANRNTYDWSSVKSYRILYRGEPRNPRKGVEPRKLADKWGEFHGNISIYDNYVTLMTFVGKLVVVIVESSTMKSTMQMLFEIAWDASKTSQK